MHRIRLRGPWTKTLSCSSDAIRTSVPDRVALVDHPTGAAHLADAVQSCITENVVVYERRFNRPTGLEPDTLVLLSIEMWLGKVIEISVNGHPLLIADAPFETDITQCLEPHNCLRVSLSGTPAALPCLNGEVSLMIRDATIDQSTVWTTTKL